MKSSEDRGASRLVFLIETFPGGGRLTRKTLEEPVTNIGDLSVTIAGLPLNTQDVR